MDRISNLPDVVIEGILKKLPLVDQVRTSVLSSGWRHRWAKIPSLVIDQAFYDFLSTSKPVPKKRRSNSKLLLNADYLNVINSLLVQHIGHLHEFSLFIPPNDQGLMPAYHLPVQSFLRNGTSSLTLISVNYYGYDWFALPLFSVVGLKHLTLKGCELRLPPAFHGFPNLISFYQYGCCSDRSDTLSCLISSCPALEVVKVHGFDCQALNISSPRLRSLFLSGEFKSISLRSAQTIEIFKLFCTAFDPSSVDLNVINNMTNLKHLTLGENTYKILANCTDLPRFSQMNKLSFYVVCLHDDIDVLKCMSSLCASSPNLKELDIKMQYYYEDDDTSQSQSVIESFSDHDFDNLRTINIEEVSGLKSEMNLIELLLSRSPLLELMSIKVYCAPSKKLTIVEDVAGFCRLSPNAKIKFVKHMNMNDDDMF